MLDDYTKEDSGAQKQTHITFSNPDHPESSANYATEEEMREHFRAANSIQNTGINRKKLVGDFLAAVEQEHVQGHEGAIEEFFASL